MKRAALAVAGTAAGLFWVLTFKVTPHHATAVSPSHAPSESAPTPSPPATPGPATPAAAASATPTPGGTTGTFTGTDVPTIYGDVQVSVVMSHGRITDVKPLQLPSDRARSEEITQVAGPILRSEAIQAQSAQVDVVSGATYTSAAYSESLSGALQQAHKS